jgi:hypothetical protein
LIRRAPHLKEELAALIAHIELQQTAWWSDAVQSVILATLYRAQFPMQKYEINENVRSEYGFDIGPADLEDSLVNLQSTYQVTDLGDGRFRTADDAAHRVRLATMQWQLQAEAARQSFVAHVLASAPQANAERIWIAFQKDLLEPLVKDLALSAWIFLTNDRPIIEESLDSHLNKFLRTVGSGAHEVAKEAALAFFDPETEASRKFVADTLNAYYFMTACGLTPDQIQYIEKILNNYFDTVLFFDVDLILAAKGLSDGNAIELLSNLMESRGNEHVGITEYFVADISMSESIEVLRLAARTMAHDETPKTLVLQGPLFLSVQRAIAARLDANDPDSAGFFRDSANSLSRRPPFPIFEVTGSVTARSDAVSQSDIRTYRSMSMVPGEEKLSHHSKSRILHDLKLRAAVRTLRGGDWPDLTRCKYWLVTDNVALLRFDAFFTRRGAGFATCVHPLTFLQMLRLSTRRSEGLDRATIASIRLAFGQIGAAGKLDQAAARVLGALARYEQRGLGEEDVVESVLNEELRRLTRRQRKMITPSSNDAEVIRQEIVELKAELDAFRLENRRLRKSFESERRARDADRFVMRGNQYHFGGVQGSVAAGSVGFSQSYGASFEVAKFREFADLVGEIGLTLGLGHNEASELESSAMELRAAIDDPGSDTEHIRQTLDRVIWMLNLADSTATRNVAIMVGRQLRMYL